MSALPIDLLPAGRFAAALQEVTPPPSLDLSIISNNNQAF
jgi:hypothetical protein